MSMEFLLATGVGMVTATGIYLMLRGRSFPVVLGLSLFGYAVNVFIFLMGRLWTNAAPVLVGEGTVADPLPQALVLTAIVIGFATTGFVIELALRSHHDNGGDHVDGGAHPVSHPVDEPVHPTGQPAQVADSTVEAAAGHAAGRPRLREETPP